MTKLLDKSISAIRQLPDAAQDQLGELILDDLKRYQSLQDDLATAEASLERGEGVPAEPILSRLRKRYGA